MATIAYIRVSTYMQCYESQKHEINTYCYAKGFIIDRWISESISGTIEIEKRALGRAIKKMRRGDTLICTELSRLGRNMLMIMGILNECMTKGISIHTIKDNFDLGDNINSKIVAFAFAMAAEIERNLISQRTKEALAAKRLEGVKLGRPTGASRKYEVIKCKYPDIERMIKAGMPLSTIAQNHGIHRNTLRKYLKLMSDY